MRNTRPRLRVASHMVEQRWTTHGCNVTPTVPNNQSPALLGVVSAREGAIRHSVYMAGLGDYNLARRRPPGKQQLEYVLAPSGLLMPPYAAFQPRTPHATTGPITARTTVVSASDSSGNNQRQQQRLQLQLAVQTGTFRRHQSGWRHAAVPRVRAALVVQQYIIYYGQAYRVVVHANILGHALNHSLRLCWPPQTMHCSQAKPISQCKD